MAVLAILFITVCLAQTKLTMGNRLPYLSYFPHYEAYEDASIGFLVGNVTANDNNKWDTLTMYLDSVGQDLFDLVDPDGVVNPSGYPPLHAYLRLKRKLDREARKFYDFKVIVKDDFQSTDRDISTTLLFIVLNVNDNKPVFQGTPYTKEIKENTPSKELIQVSADDADGDTVLFYFTDDCKTSDCQSFLINTVTGKVSLIGTLDYEKKNLYNLNIIAKDRGSPSLNSTTTLVVKVTDESDQPPEFEKSSYRADINESIIVGSSVVQVKAFDGDRGINNPVEYAITGGDKDHNFTINNSTGLITTNSSIDRDAGKDYFELTVEATEASSNVSSSTTVFITIEDVNDHKPTFPTTGIPYTTSIPEDTPVNTPVFFQMGATDQDREAKNNLFEYSIDGDPENFFEINPKTGRIVLKKKTDYEMEEQFTFVVVARETISVERFSANQTVTVNISNVNDNVPTFNESQYNFTVNESDKPGTFIGQVTATDSDRGELGEITYSLSGDGADKFSVAQDNGTISVGSSLDFESKRTYFLKVEAKDGGDRITRVPVNILLTDFNDNKPVFQALPASASINENQKTSFSVIVKATDGDSGNNSMISYSIVGGDPLNNFSIDCTSGEITNTGPLDYEIKKNFSLIVMAEDHGIPPQNDTKSLLIQIIDQNDNAPYFNQTFFNVSLMENTDIDYPIVRLYAFDEDSGTNAELVYSIVSGNEEKKFIVNADGVILTRSSPDREKTMVYVLNVSASDGGNPKKYAYARVVVNILDENDESPKFEKTVDKKILKEGPGSLNSTVANNTASDGDNGLNGTVEYMIADGNNEGMFAIDRDTGEVTVARELDFEAVRIFSLKIVADDKGIPSKSGEYQLVVEVLDINDNQPKFGQPEYSFTVMENRPKGTVIATLTADDRDSGNNSVITYSFSLGNVGSAFSIDDETGQISTQRQLDREIKNRCFLTVKAKDHGAPSLEGTTNVTVTILDENDQIPQFSNSSFHISIPEDTAKGTSIFTLSATDGDDGPAGQVTYLMQDIGNLENGNNVFSVGSQSGEVKTAISLDFEEHRNFTLTITASDRGAPSLSSNVTLVVTITDVDDNPPMFIKDTWSARVNENARVGTVITQVNATDDDFEDAHRTIYYVIKSGNGDGVFGIGHDNGTVYVANTTLLDRETNNNYELIVEARTLNEFKNDTVQQKTTKLIIQVDDYNDNSPVFRQASYSKKIPESFELDEQVVTVNADDMDVGENKRISYSISSGNDAGIFAIDNVTGIVTIVKRLDRETSHSHTFTVTARDHGSPSLESNVSVVVTVTDTNDKKPTLIIQLDTFTILENATIGTVLTQFNATDEDLDKNAKVGYRIVSGNTDGIFDVNNETGQFFTVQHLDYEAVQKYEVGVQAFDYGSPELQSDIKIITINVKDVNDNSPTFKSQKSATMSVFENENAGAVVGTVRGSDDDETDPLFYYIRGGNGAGYFSINDSTGIVTTTAQLDREKNATYFIYVEVFNSKQTSEYIQSLGPVKGNPRRRKRSVDSDVIPVTPVEDNIQLVTISIADKNDNPPYFKYKFYKAGVSESAEYQSRITQIKCIDNDKGNNSKLVYKVINLDPKELLSVEPETGWILAGQQQYFASGVGKAYSFSYSCEDPSFTATTNVTIFVLVDDQRVRLTLGINDTEYVRENIDIIKRALDEATGLEFNVDNIQYHLQGNGRYDLSKTDIFMHAVDPKTNKVVDKNTALTLIDTNYGRLIGIFQRYKVNAVEPKKPDDEEDGFDVTLTAAVALGVILFMFLLCFLCVICLMRRSHNRKLRAAKASGSQEQSFGLATPGTNLHVYEGSNPIWMDPYDNWADGVKNSSDKPKMYEAQELSMDMLQGDSLDNRVIPETFYESTANGAAYHPNGILCLGADQDEAEGEEVTSI